MRGQKVTPSHYPINGAVPDLDRRCPLFSFCYLHAHLVGSSRGLYLRGWGAMQFRKDLLVSLEAVGLGVFARAAAFCFVGTNPDLA